MIVDESINSRITVHILRLTPEIFAALDKRTCARSLVLNVLSTLSVGEGTSRSGCSLFGCPSFFDREPRLRMGSHRAFPRAQSAKIENREVGAPPPVIGVPDDELLRGVLLDQRNRTQWVSF